MNREEERREAQLAFAASGAELQVGDPAAGPLPVDVLAAVEGREPFVVQAFGGGLTAQVFRLRADGRDWTLKRARVPCLVQNVDGQTSFLNEVQRRADLAELKAAEGGAARFRGVVDTRYASYRRGLLLSPWIEGHTVAAWDERQLRQLFDQLVELLLAGLFEWDFCPGNILDDGRQLWLFDFGYMYRFDPLRELHSSGLDPLFHGAERFETRNYFAFLLRLEEERGLAAALEAFRTEKRIALEAYRRLIAELSSRDASPSVLAWLGELAERWRAGLEGDLAALYLAEGWRSHRLDLLDDLHGRTCTRTTLRRADWLIDAARNRFDALRGHDALFHDDSRRSAAELVDGLEHDRRLAEGWQVSASPPRG